MPKHVSIGTLLLAGWLVSSSALAEDPKAKAVIAAKRPFIAPEMTPPSIDDESFSSTDVGAKIHNYTLEEQWGTQGAPLTLMQDPLPAEKSVKAYATPKGMRLSFETPQESPHESSRRPDGRRWSGYLQTTKTKMPVTVSFAPVVAF